MCLFFILAATIIFAMASRMDRNKGTKRKSAKEESPTASSDESEFEYEEYEGDEEYSEGDDDEEESDDDDQLGQDSDSDVTVDINEMGDNVC